MPPRLKEKFDTQIVDKLKEQFSVKNAMEMPRLEKIVINVGMGNQIEGTKLNAVARDQVINDLRCITGQQPVMCKAKKSVSNFKVRAGMEVGVMVTLRGVRMWEFFDRLLTLAIPRIKDFRGLSDKAFDGRGNYAMGVDEHGIFPEVDMANAKFEHGMNVNFIFTHSDNDKSMFVLREIGMPFTREDEN